LPAHDAKEGLERGWRAVAPDRLLKRAGDLGDQGAELVAGARPPAQQIMDALDAAEEAD